MTTPWQEEVAILRVAKGALYKKRRDALLAAPPATLRSSLEQLSTSPDAAQATTTSILVGWMDHRPLYEAILAELDAVDVGTVGASQVGFEMVWRKFNERAARTWKHAVLPLCWEEITRFASGAPDWRISTFLSMIRAVPDVRSVEPVFAALEAAEKHSLAEVYAATLRTLPPEPVVFRAEALYRRHDEWAGVHQRLLRGIKK